MKHHNKEQENHCIACKQKLPNPSLAGATCNHCRAIQAKLKASQRLAGQIPPQGFSV